jgi:metal-sulfur cluster biosynthetic enzyme
VTEEAVTEEVDSGDTRVEDADKSEPVVVMMHAAAAPLKQASTDDVEEAMKDVVDPEIGVNIVDLGLVYGVTVDDDNVATLDMTLTSAACPLTDVIEDQTRAALEGIVAGYRINWVWMPPWDISKITDDGKEQMQALGFNV